MRLTTKQREQFPMLETKCYAKLIENKGIDKKNK
jgi:hypothetical protein